MLKKSLVAVLIAFMFALATGAAGTFAAETAPSEDTLKAIAEVDKTNAKIDAEIKKAQAKSYELYDKKVSDLEKATDAGRHVKIEAKYEEKINKLIANLDEKTQKMTSKGSEKATEAGLVVEIEWVEVQFADRTAMIDPMKVIDW